MQRKNLASWKKTESGWVDWWTPEGDTGRHFFNGFQKGEVARFATSVTDVIGHTRVTYRVVAFHDPVWVSRIKMHIALGVGLAVGLGFVGFCFGIF